MQVTNKIKFSKMIFRGMLKSAKVFLIALWSLNVFSIDYVTIAGDTNARHKWTMDFNQEGTYSNMIIKDKDGIKKIRIQNEQVVSVEIFDGTRLLRRIDYNYVSKEVIVLINQNNGTVKKEVIELEGNVWENETMIYLIGKQKLKEGKRMLFQNLNSEAVRLVEMYLENKGIETIYINGKSYDAVKYEMGLNGFFMSKLWPHKYFWWYEKSTGTFLQYKGMGEEGDIPETYELAD